MKSLLGSLVDKNPAVPTRPTMGRTFSPVGGGGLAGGGATPEQSMRAYGSVSTLFAIVDRLATATATPRWHLMKKGTDIEVMSHPCVDLWNKPNPFYTQNDFIEAVQQHMDLVGEMWWIIARSSFGVGPPLEIWPVRPDKMTPIPDPKEFIKGYIYTNGAEKVPLELNDVLMTKKQNPLDPYRGIGPVQTMMMDLDSERYGAAWNANFFRNSALPGGVIEVDGHLDDQAFEEMVLRWREQHQGVANSHRIAILEKAHFQEMKYTQRDMQFTQLRQSSQEIIALAFGFPLHMLGVSKDINRANAEAQEVTFGRWLVVPRLERIKQLLTKLLDMFGEGQSDQYEWTYDNPVPEDKKGDAEILTAAAQAVTSLINAGFDPAEVLEAAHLPQMKHTAPAAAPGEPGAVPGSQNPLNAPAKDAQVKDILYYMLHDANKKDTSKDWARRLSQQGSALDHYIRSRWG